MINMRFYYIADILSILSETILLYFFAICFLQKQHGSFNRIFFVLPLATTAHFILNILEPHFSMWYFGIMLAFIIDGTIVHFLFSGKVIVKVRTLVVFYVGLTAVEYITISVINNLSYSYSVEAAKENSLSTIIFAALIRLTEYAFLFLFVAAKKFASSRKLPLSCFLLSPVMSVLVMWLFYPACWEMKDANVDRLLVALALTLLLFNIYLFVYFHVFNHTFNRYQQLLESYHAQREAFQIQTENSKGIRKLSHDIRHHFGFLSSVIERGDIQKALDYLSDLNRYAESLMPQKITGHDDIDSSLSRRILESKRNGVELIISGTLPNTLPILAVDLNILMGNALDNAIAAVIVLPAEEREVNIAFTYACNRFSFKVQNRYGNKVRKLSNHTYYSHKHEGAGLGIEIMNEVAAKYDGTILIDSNGHIFTLTAYMNGK